MAGSTSVVPYGCLVSYRVSLRRTSEKRNTGSCGQYASGYVHILCAPECAEVVKYILLRQVENAGMNAHVTVPEMRQ